MTQKSSNGTRGQLHRETWHWKGTEDLQRTVLAAARELFTTHGFSSVTVADLTDRAGVSVGSLYHHFGAKDQLYLSLWREYSRLRSQASVRPPTTGNQLYATSILCVIGEGARAVAAAPDLAQAKILTDAAVAQSRCLLAGGPAGCAAEITD